MSPFHGMAVILLGIGYLLRVEPAFDHRNSAAKRFDDEIERAEQQRMHRGTKRTYFYKDSPEKVTVVVGQTVVLSCRVKNLGNRTVSWIRKRDLHILTYMSVTYTSDARFTIVGNPKNDDWNLRIDYVQPRDAGIYECQVNTEPKICRAVALKVLDVQAKISGPEEVYVKKGSTISLTCTVDAQEIPPSNVTWYHAGAPIDFDGPRGGVSLETEKRKNGTSSKLLITRALINDSGNYTCVSGKVAPASVTIHVLNGEHPAAMQHGGTSNANRRAIFFSLLLLVDTILR
ncbi:PREDICTED: hemicentin-2-like [Dufourea novaeangliae]|uniref:Immunoglobulin superfamily DCC subclass member 4 n=1 Tax=Dufourea novaeangliae TaxID=178035 RepID=A0A154PL35_DUFNO|nr:PREDICTED: hemicentin-2-like [Dufourea novaeangliae]KZC12562.1 Immunoglobulin superfamily DCC subclass member 4 [Dufourea novaeangliae]